MESISKKHGDLPAAIQAFPKIVFQKWLRLRRQGADQIYSEWREIPSRGLKIRLLDMSARYLAAMN